MISSLSQKKTHLSWAGGHCSKQLFCNNQDPEFEVNEAETKHLRANTGRNLESLRVSSPCINHSKPHQEEETSSLLRVGDRGMRLNRRARGSSGFEGKCGSARGVVKRDRGRQMPGTEGSPRSSPRCLPEWASATDMWDPE
jgi:hypothetical protein